MKQGTRVVQQSHNIIRKTQAIMTSAIEEDTPVLLEQ